VHFAWRQPFPAESSGNGSKGVPLALLPATGALVIRVSGVGIGSVGRVAIGAGNGGIGEL